MKLTVREMVVEDIESVVDYFCNADAVRLLAMGADIRKIPIKSNWIKKHKLELAKEIKNKEYYYLIWELNNQAIGHSNINQITFSKVATMHLHMWNINNRKNGLGSEFLKMTLPYYFKNFKLEKLICEPYSKNIGPHKALEKVGFIFIKEYETVPGIVSFKQNVSLYEMTKDRFNNL